MVTTRDENTKTREGEVIIRSRYARVLQGCITFHPPELRNITERRVMHQPWKLHTYRLGHLMKILKFYLPQVRRINSIRLYVHFHQQTRFGPADAIALKRKINYRNFIGLKYKYIRRKI